MTRFSTYALATLIIMFTAVVTTPSYAKDKPLSYTKDIQPLMKRSCVKCHGEKKQKGELRLDSLEAILKGGESKGATLVAGDSAKSPLYEVISLDPDHDDYMPPKGKPLKTKEVKLIKRWIDGFSKADLEKAGLPKKE